MKIHWIVLIGLALGVAGGLYYAWTINPVQYYDSLPDQLAPRYRSRWIKMTAFAYSQTADMQRAEARLQRLSGVEIRQGLAEALELAVAEGQSPAILARMAALAQHYAVQSPAIAIYADSGAVVVPTAESPTPTPSPMPTSPAPSPTPSPTLNPAELSIVPTPTPPGPAYVIADVARACLPEPRIAISVTQQVSVTVRDQAELVNRGLPNVEVWLLWPDGADRAITGLRPDRGLGYADFRVEPLTTYHLYVVSPTGAPLTDLSVEPCETQEEATWRSWLLTIRSTEIISP